jgi:alcohol dehydrogenase
LKAIVYSNGNLELKSDLADPRPKEGEALVRVQGSGICGTDLAICRGDYKINKPVVLGHEIYGVSDSKDGRFQKGTRIVPEINISCGSCVFCRSGIRTQCLNRSTIGIDANGGFAEYLCCPTENLHKIPDEIADDEAVFVEPLAAAIQLTKMSEIRPSSTFALIGPGRLGLLLLQVIKQQCQPRSLVVFGRRKGKKLDLASSLGATEVYDLDSEQNELDKAFREGFDHVVEASGTSDGLNLAVKLVRPRGKIHAKSTHGLPVNFDLTQAVIKEVMIQCSRCGPFEEAIDILRQGKISTRELITHRFPLERFVDAFAAARSRDGLKVLFESRAT